MTKKPVILPRVMSKLIVLALNDLKKVERSRRYRVDMAIFHAPTMFTGTLAAPLKCTVCFAGAVMAARLGAPRDEELYPDDFKGNAAQLQALDHLRRGRVGLAAESLGRSGGKAMAIASRFDRDVPNYTPRTRKAFHTAMRKLARDLKAVGL